MWTLRIAGLVTLIAAIGTWIAKGIIIDRYIGSQLSNIGLFMIAHPVSKLGMLLLLALGSLLCLAAVIALFIGRSAKDQRPSSPIEPVIWLGVFALIGLSVVINGYQEIAVQTAINEVGPVSFAVTAPQRVEQLFVFELALWPSAFALIMMLIARTRRANALGA
ncbi:hypothetical protein [Brevundimonas pishanensis]|uniref:hypothetical protein n=1 Tax=Brevundimonas pishanensis TaxID=2896315 RepID=UPI001FA70F30|nr:hypothetical protein [Brevundimonas pishanensis]